MSGCKKKRAASFLQVLCYGIQISIDINIINKDTELLLLLVYLITSADHMI